MVKRCLYRAAALPFVGASAVAFAGACTGVVDAGPQPGAGRDEAPTNGSRPDDGDDAPLVEAEDGPCSPLPARIWRLTNSQYVAAMADAFALQGFDQTRLPRNPEDPYTGFANTAASNFVSVEHARVYFDAARSAATAAVAALVTEKHCIVAAPDPACVAGFIEARGRRAFRRPLQAAEVSRYQELFSDARESFGADVATRLVLEALAQSPDFLYRTELGDAGAVRALEAFEKASLLALSLTDAPPDEALLEAAAAGVLDTPEGVRDAAATLLASKRAANAFADFIAEHLGLQALGEAAELEQALQSDLETQNRRFVTDIVWGEAADGTALDLYLGNATVANQRLATLQGLGPAGGEFTRIETDGRIRFGALTGAFLAAHVGPVKRGQAFKVRLLCESVPEPPPAAAAQAAALFPTDEDATEAELFERFRASAPSCAGCHATFHPLGLAFERYDEQGGYRERNHAGHVIDTANEVAGADGWSGRFTSARDLVEQVVQSEVGQACFARRYVTYIAGENLMESPESCTVRPAVAALRQEGLGLSALIIEAAVAAATRPRAFEE